MDCSTMGTIDISPPCPTTARFGGGWDITLIGALIAKLKQDAVSQVWKSCYRP